MIAATFFSGIGAPECAMAHWDWRWCAEIEKFPSAVLRARYPHSVNLGDVNAEDFVERAERIGRPDVLVFGSPCQDFSVAGRRVGLDGDRGNLALVALGIVNRLRPRWVVFENVPGLLSSRSGSAEAERSVREGPIGGRADSDEDSDFAAFLSLVQQCGYLGCYRITDAQYARVPQRRRRIFAVFHIGDWRPAAAVLFEPEGLRGDHPPSRETGKGVAPTISSRPTGGGGLGTDFDLDGGLDESSIKQSFAFDEIAPTLRSVPTAGKSHGKLNGSDRMPLVGVPDGPVGAVSSKWSKGSGGPAGDECYNLIAAPLAFNARQDPDVYGDRTGPLDTDPGTHAIAFSSKDYGGDAAIEQSPTLRAMEFDGSHANGGGQVAVAFQTRFARNGRGDASELVPALNGADAGATSDMRPCVAVIGGDYADAEEANTTETLRSLRWEIGEEAFAEWSLAISASLREAEVLRPEMYGRSIRRQTAEAGCGMDGGALSREETSSEGAVPKVRSTECDGRPSWGRGLSEQLSQKLNQTMSKLSHEGAPASAFLRSLRRAGEGIGVLQQALPPVQGGSTTAVRRLTPVECERLQAFPDNWTNIVFRGKPAADGPRYKALGNAMNVNEIRWVLQRIEQFEREVTKGGG